MEGPIGKLPVGGIKLSHELVQLHLMPGTGVQVHDLLDRLAQARINLVWVSLDGLEGQLTGCCGIAAADRDKAESALLSLNGRYEILSPVGTITIFPHRSRVKLMEAVMTALAAAGIPIFGLVSSFSALTLATEFRRLDEAVAAVCRIVDLPENHTPFRPGFCVKQL